MTAEEQTEGKGGWWRSEVSRRDFIKKSAGSVLAGYFALSALEQVAAKGLFRSLDRLVPTVDNPLAFYPNRDWEKVYRNLYREDSSYTFLCAPNDTHNCLLRAHVKNGAISRISPTYGYNQATDVYGTKVSPRWDPRCCQKGLAMVRKIYGPRRVKEPMVRKGFLRWADAGFPREANGLPPKQYMNRGKDDWVNVSWDRAFELAARAMVNITKNYNGGLGKRYLQAQGYDPAVVEKCGGLGIKTLKFRGGMAFLGAVRLFGLYRFANSLALLDANLRGVGPDQAKGARGWDSYSWHTDLPPGHPMVTGQQTVDFDLALVEHSEVLLAWGMNWITTKMPDAHWLTEARAKGTRVVCITCEYSATASKSDDVLIIRPGTDTALALGMAQVVMKEKRYNEQFVQQFTDLPLLVRLDNAKLLKAADIIPNYQQAALENKTRILKKGEKAPPSIAQSDQLIPEEMRKAWGDAVVWDKKTKAPSVVTRDEVGKFAYQKDIQPALNGTYQVKLVSGEAVEVRPNFDLIQEYLDANCDPDSVSKITWAPKDAIVKLARLIAAHPEKVLFAVGMGPNHFFNNDLKDRAIFLLASLTRNVGYPGGNVGSYAGNYRGAYFNGLGQYTTEDPFDIERDPDRPARQRKFYDMESAHYFNYGDRPLRVGKKLFTGDSHMPTPTKLMWFANSNSILGNLKWHYDAVVNTLPRIEAIIVNEWWWTASCEYADIVFPVDSWGEPKFPDMTASVTNPFLTLYPRTPIPRLFNTRGDMETFAGVAKALAKITGDRRFNDYWKFVGEQNVHAYLQRIINQSSALKGYDIHDLEKQAMKGIPALLMTETYPKWIGRQQTYESVPWYTKTGRLEFYRDENEFIQYGENLPVYREPVDATLHEPNVILAKPHPVIRPEQPESFGVSSADQSVEVRQVRNILRTVDEIKTSKHPLMKLQYTNLYLTPKYRHGAHTTPIDVDMLSVWFGPFGDLTRRDQRMPWVGEGYVDLNPHDAKALGVADGDYVWIDADPEDRPYRGWKKGDKAYHMSRCMLRARYYPGIPKGVARSWFNMYGATYGSVEGHEKNKDGLARNPRTGYQAMFRYGSHQSATRAWLRPTLMTDGFVRKDYFGQKIGTGFAPDIYCADGAPKESFVKITKAEPGGIGKRGVWRPVQLGFRPTSESDAMKQFLAGEYIRS